MSTIKKCAGAQPASKGHAPFFIATLFVFLLVAGCTTGNQSLLQSNAGGNEKLVLFKSPSCSCCHGHAAELSAQGFSVEIIDSANLAAVKQQHAIPQNMQSCHTIMAGDYFIEGHVPIPVIRKLLEERPDIDGISLPGMPAGSPGMPGIKNKPFTIYALKNGVASVYTNH